MDSINKGTRGGERGVNKDLDNLLLYLTKALEENTTYKDLFEEIEWLIDLFTEE